ncbi:zinc ribbon domain-containing protein [Collinsella sp. AGMB00827]|uniref:Zinc ribbon domain-containing protein n=1 Tax=Collinsella ureilytica TaxID=2869515 RepID=A0ABS7ML92_9ACTN|nr:zinc ribbon domain-containing protein [Collinsella urealyticum]
MICPKCLASIDDGLAYCPACHARIRSDHEVGTSEFLFCEGCGARLTAHDRTCPKCGRPAPGILSTHSASADLAAGRTASFPRQSQRALELETPDLSVDTARLGADTPAVDDPFATSSLPAQELASAAEEYRESDPPSYDVASPRSSRRFITLGAGVVLAAIVGFFALDPYHLVPGMLAALEQSAKTMYPSRDEQKPAADEGSHEPDQADEQKDGAKKALSDADAYRRLAAAWKTIVAQHDALASIIDDYNAGYIAPDPNMRHDCAASAYGARTILQSVTSEIQEMKFQEGSEREQDRARLLELAGWVSQRVGIYCDSWDISLALGKDERPIDHEQEILGPLRERAEEDAQARDAFFAHVASAEPKPSS